MQSEYQKLTVKHDSPVRSASKPSRKTSYKEIIPTIDLTEIDRTKISSSPLASASVQKSSKSKKQAVETIYL